MESKRTFVQGLCIFCLHDEGLQVYERIKPQTYTLCDGGGFSDLGLHLHGHFHFVDGPSICLGVEAGTCNMANILEPKQLWDHVCEVHCSLTWSDKYGPGATGREQRAVHFKQKKNRAFVKSTARTINAGTSDSENQE